MHNLKTWKIAGIISIAIFGFLMHYLYNWSNGLTLVGLIAPVNESVWEHLKLGYWAVLLFAIIEYPQLRNQVHNYPVARFTGVLVLELTIVVIFYGYTLFTGENIIWIDIGAYLAGVILCQYVTHRLFKAPKLPVAVNRSGLAALISLGLLFAVLTYYPPHVPLFKDGNHQAYGIKKEK